MASAMRKLALLFAALFWFGTASGAGQPSKPLQRELLEQVETFEANLETLLKRLQAANVGIPRDEAGQPRMDESPARDLAGEMLAMETLLQSTLNELRRLKTNLASHEVSDEEITRLSTHLSDVSIRLLGDENPIKRLLDGYDEYRRNNLGPFLDQASGTQ